MKIFVLSPESASSTVESLIHHASKGGVEVRDSKGNVIAYVLTPHDRDAWTYAEANAELMQHKEELQGSLTRRGGVTTSQLLNNAMQASNEADPK